MIRFITPIILIGIAITVFFVFANPVYKEISDFKVQVASRNEALNNHKSLSNERDKLVKKLNAINPDDLTKLEKLLPENVDNIRLILEIGEVASPYGMILKDVKYSTIEQKPTEATVGTGVVQGGGVAEALRKDYGVWDLEFSTVGTYNNFLSFLRAIERNLRIVDISSIQFSSNLNTVSGLSLSEAYKYNFKIKTYWLKN